MRAILTGTIAAIEAVAVALATLLVTAVIAFGVWWLSFDLAAEPSEVLSAAGGGWLLAHFVPLDFTLTAESMQLLGFEAKELGFTLSLAPLGLTLVTVWIAARSGWRLGSRGGAGGAGVLGGALGFGATAIAVAALVPASSFTPPLAGLCCALVYGVPSLLGFLVRSAREQRDWWLGLVSLIERGVGRAGLRRPDLFSTGAGSALRLAAMLVAGYLGLAALGCAIALIGRYAAVIAASQALQLDVWGAIMMFVLQLALLPVFVIWAGSWFTGAGFAVGLGTSASPFGALLGPLPGIPAFAAIPDGWGGGGALAPVLLALVGVAVGASLGRVARERSALSLAATVVSAAVVAGLSIALLSWAAAGSLGPGRLAVTGSEVWVTAGLAAAELGIGCLLGALAARADVLRVVAGAPATVLGRVGLLDGEAELGDMRAAASARAAESGVAREGGSGAERTESDGIAGESPLAPVSPLFPAGPGAAGAGASGTGAAGDAASWYGVDEQVTEQITEHLTEQITEQITGRIDVDAFAEDGPEPGEEPQPAREPELFDQHGAAQEDGAEPGTEPDTPAAVDPATLDADALVEAYSWDRPEDAPEEKRTGWRWPGRKG